MKKRIIIGIIIVALISGGFYFKNRIENRNNLATVKTSMVSKGDVKAYLSTTAVIKSKNSKDYFGQQLKIAKVNVKVGDNVTKGQVMLTYDVADINNNVKQAEIQYNNAVLSKQILTNNNKDINSKIAELDKQIKDIDATISQYRNSTNPTEIAKIQTLETQKSQLKSAKDNLKPISNEQLKQADNAISLAKITLDSAKAKISEGKDSIIAEFDGVVTVVNALEGGVGNPAVATITVQDINNLKAVVSVGKYDAEKIRIDQLAEIKSNGTKLAGKVAFIDPVAKKNMSATGTETTLNTEIDILDRAEGLKVDFDTDINILLGEKKNVIKVPAEAVRTDKTGRTFVFVVEDTKAVEKTVKLGLQSDMEAEVLEGLAEGDKVILNPVASISNGTVVKENANAEVKK